MRAMTRDEARAWKRNWDLLREREVAALQTTPLALKLQQMSSLLQAALALGWAERTPEEAIAIEVVRDRWIRLKGAVDG